MPLPSPEAIKLLALEHGYEERRSEASSTLFFKDGQEHQPTLVNVFYTTGGVMTKLAHPSKGYNELWRSDAYDSLDSLAIILADPRVHTGKGRRGFGGVRGCAGCGTQKKRDDFSKTQWRKSHGESRCSDCVRPSNKDTLSDVVTVNWTMLVDAATCDAEGCDESSPTIRCSCTVFYYCSDGCRERHAWEHSPKCIDVEEFRAQSAGCDPNLKSGLCNASASTLQQTRGRAMAMQLSGNSLTRSAEYLLMEAEAIHQQDRQWQRAVGLYQEIIMRYSQDDLPTSQWRQVYMGFSRCCYELKKYDHAIEVGEGAIMMNRHFPQVHKYVALSQKASQGLPSAIKTMKRAVLYEAPWSDETVQSNKALLCQLMHEEETQKREIVTRTGWY